MTKDVLDTDFGAGDLFTPNDAFDTLAAFGAGLCGYRVDDPFLPPRRPEYPPEELLFEGSRADVLEQVRRVQVAYERNAFLAWDLFGRTVWELWKAFERTALVVTAAVAGAATGDPKLAPVVVDRPTDTDRGRGLPAGARFTTQSFFALAAPAVGAPGWCADVRDALFRGDHERLGELWRTVGTVAIAPNLSRQAARSVVAGCVNVTWVYGDRFGGRQARDPAARPKPFIPAVRLIG